MILFSPRVHRWEKWSQSGKTPPVGRAEIENVKYAKSDIFNFNSATRWRFRTFTPLFTSMEHCSKKCHSDFLIRWVLANFTEIFIHEYQVSLKKKKNNLTKYKWVGKCVFGCDCQDLDLLWSPFYINVCLSSWCKKSWLPVQPGFGMVQCRITSIQEDSIT